MLPVVTVDSIDDAITRVNDGEKPLALYLFSSEPGRASGGCWTRSATAAR